MIGAKLVNLKEYPSSERRGKKKKAEGQSTLPSFVSRLFIDHLIGKIGELERISDDSLSDIKRKERVFEEFRQLPEYRKAKAMADVHTAVYFGNEVEPTANKDADMVYHDIVWAIKGGETEWQRKTNRAWFREAQRIAADKSFFHWELEFPEVFFEDGRVKENPGWDCVIGNPPYDVLAEKELGYSVDQEKLFFKSKVEFYPAIGNKLNLYRLFTVKGLALTKERMKFSFIIPMAILGDDQATRTRKWIINNFQIEQIEAFPQKDDPHKRVFFEAKLPTTIIVVTKDKPIRKAPVITHPGRLFGEVSKYYKLDQSKIQLLDTHSFSIPLLAEEEWVLCERIFLSKWVKKIGDQYHSYQGEINETSMKHFLTKEPIGPEILRGGVVQRYELLDTPKQGEKWFLNIEKYTNEVSEKSKKAHVGSWRIGYQRNAALDNYRRIISTIIPPEKHFFDSISYLIPEDEERFYLLAILNSNLLEFRFRLASTNNHVNGYEIEALPLRQISFTTPPEERNALVESLKSRYNANEFDKIIQLVEECLPTDTEGNFVTDEEKSDVVHDLLAFLAERMIEMNKEKNEEIKGFLEWFEREIGAKIETLTNRTKLKRYHDLDFDGLLDILKKNKKKIPVNLSNRELQGNLKDEFEGSMRKLRPLIERIEKTDELIDQVVYRLYGLSEGDVRMIEGGGDL